MKNITLLVLFALVSCSKPSSSPSQKFGQISENVIHYEEINMSFTNGVITAGSTFNYGDIPTGTTVTHDIVISNISSSPLPAIIVNSNTPGITYTIVPGVNANCSALARGKKCTVKVKYVAPATVPTPNPIVEEIVINNSSVDISGNVVPSVALIPSLSVPTLDLGTFTGSELSTTFQILNQEMNDIPAPGLVFDLTGINTDFFLDYTDCQKKVVSRTRCNLTITYATTDTNSGLVSTSFKIFDKTYTISVLKNIPILDKIALTNHTPSSGLIDFGDKKQEDGFTVNKVMRIKNVTGYTQTFLVPPVLNDFILVSNGCVSVVDRASCYITLKFNSNGKQIQEYTEKFLMENDKYKIEFDLRANVIENSEIVFCDLTNSVAGGGINNANNAVTAVEGIFPVCTVKTCQPTYAAAIDLKSCQPTVVACTVTDATNNGVVVANSNSTVKGDVIMGDISACLLADTACNLNYSRNVSGKSCDPMAFACTTLDATANGVNFTNSNSTVQGTVLAGDVSACLLANTACNLNYVRNASGKICDGEIRACTQADAVANGVSVQNVNLLSVPPFLGNVNTGDVSACLINSCITGYTKNGAGKLCLQDSRACIASDITGLGGNITNALTYSGNVILNDPAACRIATCSGAFEPTTNGLACESKAMSNLTFTITNKNANGYIKDSFAQLAINTVNALEMKISDNNNCTAGTFEPFSASKQFTIPAGRLNVLTDAPISIQFKRNATTSACIHVAGAITLATSHFYRHDNVAPTPLTITTYTENQNITAASVTFGGACFTGVNRETGLSGQTLTSASCSGAAYTSQSIATVTDGNYALYVRQVDLAGNLSEVTRNVRKITSCTLGNATSGGVRSTYGAIGVTGNLTDGCTITSCQTYTTIAGDAKECVPKPITTGSFLVTKNANGYINTTTVALTSIVATNAQTFDIFENADCSSTAKISDRTMTTSTTFTPSVYNSTNQSVSIKFKNGSEFLCVHVAGAITVPSAHTYRHDNMAPSPLTLTTTLIGSGQTITSAGTTSVIFTGTCDTAFALNLELQSPLTQYPPTCTSGTYSRTISPTFGSDGTYTFRAYQTDLAGNVAQQFYTIYRDIKKSVIVTFAGLGSGTVVGSAGGLSCPGTCSVKYAPTTITLTATPNATSSLLSGWTVTNATSTTCTGTTNPCTVSIGSVNDVSVVANFSLKPAYTLTATKGGTGLGTITSNLGGVTGTGVNCPGDCSENYYNGQIVVLTATADSSANFTGWTADCLSAGTNSTCSVTMSAAKNVTATFTPKPTYAVVVTKTGSGGSVTSSPAGINCGATCSSNFIQNSNVVLTASADNVTVKFSSWGGDCSAYGSSLTCTLSSISAAKAVTANFVDKFTYTCNTIQEVDSSTTLTHSLFGYTSQSLYTQAYNGATGGYSVYSYDEFSNKISTTLEDQPYFPSSPYSFSKPSTSKLVMNPGIASYVGSTSSYLNNYYFHIESLAGGFKNLNRTDVTTNVVQQMVLPASSTINSMFVFSGKMFFFMTQNSDYNLYTLQNVTDTTFTLVASKIYTYNGTPGPLVVGGKMLLQTRPVSGGAFTLSVLNADLLTTTTLSSGATAGYLGVLPITNGGKIYYKGTMSTANQFVDGQILEYNPLTAIVEGTNPLVYVNSSLTPTTGLGGILSIYDMWFFNNVLFFTAVDGNSRLKLYNKVGSVYTKYGHSNLNDPAYSSPQIVGIVGSKLFVNFYSHNGISTLVRFGTAYTMEAFNDNAYPGMRGLGTTSNTIYYVSGNAGSQYDKNLRMAKVTSTNGIELATLGTGGTQSDGFASSEDYAVYKNYIYYIAKNASGKNKLYRVSDTAASPVPLAVGSIQAATTDDFLYSVPNFYIHNNILYFNADKAASSRLYRYQDCN